MNEAPATRHGDVLMTVWIIVGTTVLVVVGISDTVRLPTFALAVVGALSAGCGEAVARAIRPGVRWSETAAAVVIAILLLPHVARFGGPLFDREAIITIAVGTPLGLGAAWQTRRRNVRAGNAPELIAGIAMMGAAVALAVLFVRAFDAMLPDRHGMEIGFVVTGMAAGMSFGALVPRAKPVHLVLGAMLILLAPRVFGIGVLRFLPLYDVIVWTGSLGVAGLVGCLAGQAIRTQADARAQARVSVLPEARVHEGDAGEGQDPR